MAVSFVAQMLISAAMAASSPTAAPPAPTCGSPIFDPAHQCRVREDGLVKLQCKALRDGSLTACTVVSEDPPGKGFGAAALDSATRAKIGADDKRPEEGVTVVVPIRFKAGN